MLHVFLARASAAALAQATATHRTLTSRATSSRCIKSLAPGEAWLRRTPWQKCSSFAPHACIVRWQAACAQCGGRAWLVKHIIHFFWFQKRRCAQVAAVSCGDRASAGMGECCSRLLGTIAGALDAEIWIQSIDNSDGWCVCEIRNRTSARESGARECLGEMQYSIKMGSRAGWRLRRKKRGMACDALFQLALSRLASPLQSGPAAATPCATRITVAILVLPASPEARAPKKHLPRRTTGVVNLRGKCGLQTRERTPV